MTYDIVLFSDVPLIAAMTRNHGIYALANILRKNGGYSVLVVNNSSSLNFESFKEILDLSTGSNTLMIGFSVNWMPYRAFDIMNGDTTTIKDITHDWLGAFTPDVNKEQVCYEDESVFDVMKTKNWYTESLSYNITFKTYKKFTDYIKKLNVNIKIVLGGTHAYEYVKDEYVDHILLGFCETQIIDLLDKHKKNIPMSKLINFDTRALGNSFKFKETEISYEDSDFLNPNEILSIEFSRGCIFNCDYCSWPMKGSKTKDTVKYKKTIYNELYDNWKKWGIYKYYIVDDTFNDYTEKLILIRDAIKMLPFQPRFKCFVRMDLIGANPEQAQILKDIGVIYAYYGLDTWNEKTGSLLNKGRSNQKKIDSFKIAKEVWGNDVFVEVTVIVGLPKDNESDFYDLADWYKDEGFKYIDHLQLSPLELRPTTDLSEYTFLSDIEKDFGKYGYSFPINSDPYEWHRTGEGDIKSKKHARQIIIDIENYLRRFNKQPGYNIHREFITSSYHALEATDNEMSLPFFEINHNYAIKNHEKLKNYLRLG